MKKKTVAKKRTPRKSSPKTPLKKTILKKTTAKVDSEKSLWCKQWLIEQKAQKVNTIPLQDELESDDSDELEGIKLEDESLEPSTSGSKKALSRRKKSSSPTELYLVCEWQKCHEALDTYQQLIDHVASHITDLIAKNWDPLECQWDLCDFETTDAKLLRSHCLYHTYHTRIKTVGEQMLLGKNPLPACVNDSRRRNIIADVQSDYLCMWKGCEFRFGSIQDYYDHVQGHCKFEMQMQRENRRNGIVNCEWIDCRKTFNRQAKMIEHIRSHTGERFLACSNCGSMFNSYAKFYDHYKRQAINNSYKCNQCLRCFATEELLNNHMYNHINCIKCTICDMTCPSPSALTKHFRYRHCKEKPFKCTQCDYSCVAKWDLSKHVTRMHDTEKTTYECAEFDCDYTCVTTNLMRKHEKEVHGIGQNIYCCHCCEKQYASGHTLSLHLIKKHGFQLPSGHRRFTYRQDIDGVYRVQTTRMESLEVSEQIMSPCANELDNAANVTYTLTELQRNERGLTISLKANTTKKEASRRIDRRPTRMRYKQMPAIPNNDAEGGDFEDVDHTVRTRDERTTRSITKREDHVSIKESKSILDMKVEDAVDIRNIDNFSVMQKYLHKNQANIMITVEELDKDGNVIKTETQEANEFQI